MAYAIFHHARSPRLEPMCAVMSSSCASTPSATPSTSKGRGQNKLFHVYSRTEPGPVDVVDGIPCGKDHSNTSAKTFWSWCTLILRRHHRYPLNLAYDWRNYPQSFKENLWNEMAEKWIMEPVNREYFFSHAGKLLKDIKHHYRLNYFNNLPEGANPLLKRPSDVPEPQWEYLVKQWQHEHWKENAAKHKASRVENPHSHHRMGSTGYPALAKSLTQAAAESDASVPDRFDIWLAGVKDKNGNVDDAARQIIEIFEAKCVEYTALDSASEEGSQGSVNRSPLPRERAWDYVLNDVKKSSHHGHILGMGSTITYPLLHGRSNRNRGESQVVTNQRFQEMEQQLKETQELLKKQEETAAQQAAMIKKQEETAAQQAAMLQQQQEASTQQAAMLQELMAMMTQRTGGSFSNQGGPSSDGFD